MRVSLIYLWFNISGVPFGNGSFLRQKTMGAAMRVNIMARMKAKWNESTDFVIWMMMFTNANTKQADMTTNIPKIGRKKEAGRRNVFDDFLRKSDRLINIRVQVFSGEAPQL